MQNKQRKEMLSKNPKTENEITIVMKISSEIFCFENHLFAFLLKL